jgi:folate-binding protein YgfZ
MSHASPLQESLACAGAVFADVAGWSSPVHFGNADAEYQSAWGGAVVFDRSPRGKVTVSGADTARFLHNLCTNDILGLASAAGCETFLTTNKAKAVAYALVFHQAEPARFWLDTDAGRGDTVSRHLDRYLISERAEIADVTAEFAQLHVAGPAAPVVVSVVLKPVTDPGPLQEVKGALGGSAQVWVRRRDLLPTLPGYDLICRAENAKTLWRELLGQGVVPAGSLPYEVLRVEAGIPAFGQDIDEDRTVVEVGRGTRAISYTKGCYLGQETIVMARDRGHVNRFLIGLRCEGSEPVLPGTPVFAAATNVGHVTSGVISPRHGAIALAYVRRGYQEAGTELSLTEGGRRAQVALPPF